jgi:5,10-methylenetetrahydrofolate reductase
MKIDNILREKKRAISFEFFPPKTEQAEQTLLETIEKLSSINGSKKDKATFANVWCVNSTSA